MPSERCRISRAYLILKGQQAKDMIKIEKYVISEMATNSYMVINQDTKECVMIDPAVCMEGIVNRIKENEWNLQAILLTHGHYDHVDGVAMYRELFPGIPVYAHEAEMELLADPKQNLSAYGRYPTVVKDVIPLKDDQILNLAGMEFKVLFTPGHTPGGCCYYLKSESVVFCGDTLFNSSVGRTDFPGGNMLTLIKSVKEKLFVLPGETIAYPGHMDETTIDYERQYNPFIV